MVNVTGPCFKINTVCNHLISHRPSDAASTQPTRELISPTLSCETSSLSECETPLSLTVPTLTLPSPCTPVSRCTSVTPRSPSLTSWDSWSSIASFEEEDESALSTIDSEPSLCDGDDNGFDHDESMMTASRTSSEEELMKIFGIDHELDAFNEDIDEDKKALEGDSEVFEHQSPLCPPPLLTENLFEALLEKLGDNAFFKPISTSGSECISNYVFPNVSSGIVTDCSACEDDDSDFECDKSVTVSRTSSEEELTKIFGELDDNSTETQQPRSYTVGCSTPPLLETNCVRTAQPLVAVVQFDFPSNTVGCSLPQLESTKTDCSPPTSAKLPPLTLSPKSDSKGTPSTGSKPPPLTLTPLSSGGSKPAPLTLSLTPEDDSNTPPSTPGPSTTEADQMWNEYAANCSTAPEYFLFPPFTPEQEEWIVEINHPFKEYVLQTWQAKLHSSMQGWLEDLVN